MLKSIQCKVNKVMQATMVVKIVKSVHKHKHDILTKYARTRKF